MTWLDVERVMGIEPTLFAWEAKVLPLNYTRLKTIIGSDIARAIPAGAEPPAGTSLVVFMTYSPLSLNVSHRLPSLD
jgi:hypothetical protein